MGGAECARQWGRVETIWKPIFDSMIRMQISKEAIDIMRRLPNQDYRKKVVKEMQSRIKSTRHEPQSTVMDADLVLGIPKDHFLKDEVLKPNFRESSGSHPTRISKGACQGNRRTKESTEEAQQNEETSLSEKQEELANLNDQQQDIGDSVENFAQALRQEANIQNLLYEEGREIARDSDDAAHWLKKVNEKLRKP